MGHHSSGRGANPLQLVVKLAHHPRMAPQQIVHLAGIAAHPIELAGSTGHRPGAHPAMHAVVGEEVDDIR